MLKRRGFRYFLAVFGTLALFVAGYTATSVVTACTAEAQICCTGWTDAQCIGIGSGIAPALGVGVFGLTISADLTIIALTTIPIYYAQALISFGIKVIQKLWKMTDHWFDWWDTTWNYDMSPALKDMARQITVINADQARQLGSFADAMNRERVNIVRRQEAVQSHRETKPSEQACAAGSVAGGLTQATSLSRSYNAAAPAERGLRTSHAKGTPAAGGSAADTGARYKNYQSRYCDPNENGGNAGCATAGADALADLDVTGQIFEKDTIDITNDDTRQTVDDLITNANEPRVTEPLPAPTFKSALGQQRAMEYQAYEAQRQVVYDAMYFVVARRSPGATGDAAAAVKDIEDDAGLSADSEGTGSATGQAMSRNEMLHVLNVVGPRNGKNAIRADDGPENTARKLAIQNGDQLMQMKDLMDLMDRYSMVVAGEASLQVRKNTGFSAGTENMKQQ